MPLFLVVALGAAPVEEEEAPAEEGSWFVDRTATAGLDRPHTNRAFDNPYAHIMEGYTALGAAGAAADFDNDGFEDLFVTDSKDGGKNLLYRNNGDFTFTEVGEKAGVADGNDPHNASANALWLDYDNDGHQDLLVVRFGHNQLFHNRGDGTFDNVTQGAGLGGYRNCIAAVAFDHDLDGDLDLFLGNYFAPVDLFDPQTPRFFPESFETATNGGGVTVLRNDGDGTFTEVTREVGIEVSGWTLDLGHADADHDGDDDLYIAADFGTDSFFRNDGDGTFTNISESAIGIDTKKGMNVDWGDFDNDGYFDIYVTNITDEYMNEGNFLWRNGFGDGGQEGGELVFADLGRETGSHDSGWGWAGKFFDYDNDGWLDLYVVDGWVSGSEENYVLDIFEVIVQPDIDLADARNWPAMGDKTLSGYQSNRLFHNQGGALFKDEATRHGLDSKLDGRGVAVADYDNDGRLDLFVSNANTKPFLFRNLQPTGHHWLSLALEGRHSNRDAVGARVWIEVAGERRVSFVNGGNGFASQSSRRVHFGLGAAKKVDRLEVVWPAGGKQIFTDIESDRIYRLVEGESQLRPLVTARPPADGEREK